jgi:hypothetical protein
MQITGTHIRTFIQVVLYALLVYAIQFIAYKAGVFSFPPVSNTVLGWDATWYKSIAEDGYLYWGGTQCNSGFFLFFPLLWRWLHLGIWGVCIMNVLFFSAGFTLLTQVLKPGRMERWLWLSLPPVYFAFVPYTEAVSFLLCSICLYGIQRNKKAAIISSLFLLSLTRVSVAFLAPALVAMELMAMERSNWWPALKKGLWLYLLPSIAGLALFVWYQYSVTGIWFLYFKLQAEFWGHKFAWPSLPFITTNQSRTIVLTAFATLCCTVAFVYMLYLFVRWIAANRVQKNKLLVLSLGYLSATLLLTIFFNPQSSGQTVIVGITRYGMSTPFFLPFLQYFTNSVKYKKVHFLYAFVGANLVLLTLGSYFHIRTFLYLNISTAAVYLYMLYGSKYKWAGIILIAAGIIAQALVFQDFLTGMHYPD